MHGPDCENAKKSLKAGEAAIDKMCEHAEKLHEDLESKEKEVASTKSELASVNAKLDKTSKQV